MERKINMSKSPSPLDSNEQNTATDPEIAGKLCRHCKQEIGFRNPSGFCDHLYYPENCKVCSTPQQTSESQIKDLTDEIGILTNACQLIDSYFQHPNSYPSDWDRQTRKDLSILLKKKYDELEAIKND